jgi:puromycin-sensitive aminopeptidase
VPQGELEGAGAGDTVDDYRLPRAVAPRRYEITLAPDLAEAVFSGHEIVDVEIVEPTATITLNAADLIVDEASIELANGDRLAPTIELDEVAERLVLGLATVVHPGSARVHLRFRGVLNDKLRGFYRSTFTDAGGDEQVIAVTQFESTDARRAFPCWDEPDRKAVFAMSVVAPEGMTVLSNAAEVAREAVGDGRERVRFADTMRLSTYLVAVVVGPLEVTDPVDVDGTPLRVVHPPGKAALTAYALEVGAHSLRYFSDYFGIDYPGDKLDLVAIPDFAFGAMENLGCVTFRETLLLVDPSAATQAELQNIVHVVAHEIAHMWFGDLVTMKWWNGIWLNEAFATLMEEKAADDLRPDWQLWAAFALSRSTALDTDALVSTRPVEYEVRSPRDADGMFDVLTYEKGGSVLRMLELYLGEDRFRDGIRRYMATHAYGNTETTDLWDAIEASSGEPVRRVMDTWIFQGGHPVVGASLDAAGKQLRLDQSRFVYLPDADSATTWEVPILVGIGDEIRRVLLSDDRLDLDLDAPGALVRANAGAAGFFRVRYSSDLLTALASRAQAELSSLERYALVDDTWASTLAGMVPAAQFIELTHGFAEEDDVAVWRRLAASLSVLMRVVDDDGRAALRTHTSELVEPALAKLGDPVESDGDRRRELRGVLFESLGTTGDDATTQARARELLARQLDGDDVEPNLAAAALRVVATCATEEDFERIAARFRAATTPQEKQRFLFSLALVRDPALYDRIVAMAATDEVRSQDGPYLLRNTLMNRRNGATGWRFVRQHWAQLLDRFPDTSIVRMLEGVRTFTAPELAADVEAFLAEHPVPTGEKTVDQHLERMRVSVHFAERERTRLAAHLVS